MNTCLRFVSVLFWTIDHMRQLYLSDSNWRAGRGGGVCCVFILWLTRQPLGRKGIKASAKLSSDGCERHRHTLASPFLLLPTTTPVVRLTVTSLLACGSKWCHVLNSSCIDTLTYLPTRDWTKTSRGPDCPLSAHDKKNILDRFALLKPWW